MSSAHPRFSPSLLTLSFGLEKVMTPASPLRILFR